MVLAFSSGIKGYIVSMQDDMLSGNPISIQQTGFDMGAITSMMNGDNYDTADPKKDHIVISAMIEYLIKTQIDLGNVMVNNEITQEYVDYVTSMPKEYYQEITLNYGLDFSKTIFSDFYEKIGGQGRHTSLKQIVDIYKSVFGDTDYKRLASMLDSLAPDFNQAPSNLDYINSQYNLVDGKIATEKDEVMLVLNSEDMLTDFFLAGLGYYTQEELMEVIHKASVTDDKGNPVYNEAIYRQYFSYKDLREKTFTWYPTDSLFSVQGGEEGSSAKLTYTSEMAGQGEGGLTLKVVGILTPKDTISYGVMSSGIYYTKAFTDYVLSVNKTSSFINYLVGDEDKKSERASISYSYDYLPYSAFDSADSQVERKTVNNASVYFTTKESIAKSLGGNDLASSIRIYPISFEDKILVTNYLDHWNDLHKDKKITYTDSLELIVNMLNTMIDIISYALIAFTSISLVVSTVMIGIITYVSVVERIKEIGVIRSLGGRKRDVSNLFIAETAIIGFLAGVIGIVVTYLISALVNVILTPLIGFPNIAALPVESAIFLVCLSVGLTLISGLAPAKSAAKKDPVVALRTE
jgi:putative ABC transport system permease protein